MKEVLPIALLQGGGRNAGCDQELCERGLRAGEATCQYLGHNLRQLDEELDIPQRPLPAERSDAGSSPQIGLPTRRRPAPDFQTPPNPGPLAPSLIQINQPWRVLREDNNKVPRCFQWEGVA